MKRLFLAAALCLLAAGSARAQDISASHLQASVDLLMQMDMEGIMARSIDSVMDAQLQANPQLGPFEDIMREFMADAMSWDAVGDDLARVYAEAYTEAELRELGVFYATDLGQKTIQLMPVLMQQGMEIGQQVVLDRQPELERRIEERVRELESQN